MRHPDDGLIEEYLDGELPARVRGELETHATACEACHERIEAARVTRVEADDLVALLGEPAPQAGAVPPPSFAPVPRRAPPWRILAWAATVVMAAGLGYAGGTARRLGGSVAGETGVPTERRTEWPTGRLGEGTTGPAAMAAPAIQPASPPAADTPTERRTEPPTGRVGEATLERDAMAPQAVKPSSPPAETAVRDFRRRDEAVTYIDGVPTRAGNRGTGFVSPTAPSTKQRVDGALARPVPEDVEVRLAEGGPPTLDDAVRALGGGIRLLDGLEVARVSVEWLPMPGGDSAAVVELTYADPAGHAIVLRQSRTPTVADGFASADRLARREAAAPAPAVGAAKAREGERAVAPVPALPRDGELTWVDPAGFRLVLRADADADSLARLRARVR